MGLRVEARADDGDQTARTKRGAVGEGRAVRSDAHWCGLSEHYGRWKTVHRRFSRWGHAGVWEQVFDTLTADRDRQYLMIDSTIVRAHRARLFRCGQLSID